MKKILLATAMVTGLGLSMASVTPASAADAFRFSFDTGNVAFAYSDGYWDHDHRWHKWRNAREAREYRGRYGHNYYNWNHSRERNMGWRDQDHDGIPNRYDRDRDGDGIRNDRDRMPNIPN